MSINFSKHKPAADAKIFEDKALPQNTNEDSSVFKVGAGGQNGSILLVVEVEDTVTLTATKKITVEVKTSADESTWKTLIKKEFTTAPTGQMLDFIFPPSTEESCKVNIATDDTDAAGSINAYLMYIPR